MNKVTEEEIHNKYFSGTKRINNHLHNTGGQKHGFNKSFISSKE